MYVSTPETVLSTRIWTGSLPSPTAGPEAGTRETSSNTDANSARPRITGKGSFPFKALRSLLGANKRPKGFHADGDCLPGMPTPLAELLATRIESEGPIPFSEFMQTALYDPEHGYYARESFTTGREGDFATAPDTGPLMGATLAGPVQRFARQEGRLVELGPGSGRLIADVIDALDEPARENLEVVLVEPFQARREPLARRVEERVGFEVRVVGNTAELEPARSLAFANEVLDALPVDVVQATSDGIQALHVTVGEDGFERAWRPARASILEEARPVVDRLPEGGRYELARGLGDLLGSLAEALDPGAAVVFDYGARFEDLWADGTEGTLRGFREHEHVDPLVDPGEVDITADVDFSRVMGIADALGLATAAYGGQDRLLVHLGMVEVARERDRLQDVKQLLVPAGGGFGERFRALVLDDGGLAGKLDLRVDLDDPEVWTRAMEGLSDAGGLAGLGSDRLR